MSAHCCVWVAAIINRVLFISSIPARDPVRCPHLDPLAGATHLPATDRPLVAAVPPIGEEEASHHVSVVELTVVVWVAEFTMGSYIEHSIASLVQRCRPIGDAPSPRGGRDSGSASRRRERSRSRTPGGRGPSRETSCSLLTRNLVI